MSLNIIISSYFIQNLFAHINEEIKLKLIRYNKNMQNIININLINYKTFSGKYIEYESNENGSGKGKEYNIFNHEIVFEGDYINRKRNGKGKEYDYVGKIKFEGEYSNGKRNGKGKEFNYDGNIKYEGEYFNGKKWNGKGYDKYGNIIYELKDGKGFVKETIEEKDSDIIYGMVFEGEYSNGERNGKGIEYGEYGVKIFEGDYLSGKRWNGNFYDLYGDLILELKNGKGNLKLYDEDNRNILQFDIEYLNGDMNGKFRKKEGLGIFTEGEFLNNKKHGKIKEYINKNELRFEGEYLYDYKRIGKEYIDGKLEYEGEYLFDKKWNGKGYDKNGNIIYELNQGNGKVKEFNILGKFIFEGKYLKGKKNGKGIEYKYWDGKILYEGEYLNGKRNGKGKEYDYSNYLIFDGEYLNGNKWIGKFKDYDAKGNIIFQVEYLENNRKEYSKGKLIFEGEYLNEKKWNGKGFDENGNIIYELNNGNGYIKEYNKEGILLYNGEVLNGLRNGKGKKYENGELIFEGEYLNGKKWNGKGKELGYKNEIDFEGEYYNGKRWNGKGKEYDWFDDLEFEGEYLKGVKIPNKN